jgi:hypothetical protein
MRKGQAALEFLTTYGWAFLVILVMIGALAYFGVLNPSKMLPSRCVFSPEIQCIESKVIGNQSNNGILKFRVTNSVGSTATFAFGATYLDKSELATSCDATDNGLNIRSGSTMEVNCTFSSTFPLKEKVKFEVNATYQKTGGTYFTPVKGEIYAEVQ